MPSIHFDITADNEDFLKKFQGMVQSMSNTKEAAEKAGTSIDEVLRHLTSSMDSVVSELKATNSQISKSVDSAKDVFTDAIEEVHKQYGKAIDNMKGKNQEMKEDTESMFDTISKGFKQAIGFAGVDFSLDALKEIPSKVFEMRAYFQDIESTFKTFLGDEQKALEFTSELQKYAYYNQFEFSELAQGSAQLISFGNDVKNVIPILDQLSNIAAATHAPLDEMINLYNRAKSTGVVDAQGIQSWATKGLIIKDVLKEMGHTATTSTITFEQLNDVLEHVTSEGGFFAGQMDNMFNNLSSELGGLQDNLDLMYNEIGKSIQEPLREVIHTSAEMTGEYKRIAQVIGELVAVYGAYRVALLLATTASKAHLTIQKQEKTMRALNIAMLRGESSSLGIATVAKNVYTVATNAATIAVMKMNAVLAANPYVVAAVAVAGFTVALYELYRKTQDYTTEVEKLDAAQQAWSDTESEATSVLKELKNAHDDENLSAQQQQDLMNRFKAAFPDIAKKYDTWAELQRNLAQATREANAELDKQRYLNSNTGQYNTEKNRLQELLRLRELHNKQNKSAQEQKELHALYGKYNKEMLSKRGFGDIYGGLDTLIKESADAVNNRASGARKEAQSNILDEIGKMDKAKLEKFIANNKKLIAQAEKSGKEYITIAGDGFPTALKDLRERQTAAQAELRQYNENATKNFIKDDVKQLRDLEKKLKNLDDTSINPDTGKRFKNREEFYKYRKTLTSQISALKSEVGSSNAKSQKVDKNKAKRDAKAQEAFDDLIIKQRLKGSRAEVDAIHQTEQFKINALDESTEKTVKQIELDYQKEVEAISRGVEDIKQAREDEARKVWEMDPANASKIQKGITWHTAEDGKKKFDAENGADLTETELAMFQARRDANDAKRQKNLDDAHQKELSYLYEYLKAYGTFEEKKLAIAKEYEQKIADESDPNKRIALRIQQKRDEEALNSDELFKEIDWEGMFSDLSGHSKSYLEGLKAQLTDLLGSGKLTSLEDILRVQGKVNEINALIDAQGGLFSNLISKHKEHVRLVNEAADAQERLNNALAKQNEKQEEYEKLQNEAYQRLGDDFQGTNADVNADAFKSYIDNLGLDTNSSEYQSMIDIYERLRVAENELADARDNTAKATNKAKGAEDKARKKKWSDKTSDEKFNLIRSNISSLGDLQQTLGLGDNKKLSSGISGLNDAMGAAADFMSGNYIGALTKGIDALKSFGDVLGLGADDNGYADMMAQYERISKIWDELLDKKKAYISESYAEESKKARDEALKIVKDQEEAERKLVDTYAGGGASAGSHSYGARFNSRWRNNANVVAAAQKAGINSNDITYQTLNSATAEQLAAFKEAVGSDWALMDEEFTKHWDKVIATVDESKEVWNRWREQMTGISYDGFKDEFTSALMDMDKSADDFTKSFTEKLTKSVIDARIDKLYGKELEQLYADWADAMSDGDLSDTEVESLKKRQDELALKMMETRDMIAEKTGYDDISSSEAKGSINAAKSMSDDTGNEIVGRTTAIQLGVERISAQDMASNAIIQTQLTQGVNQLIAITSLTTIGNETLENILNQQVMANSYLEDIAKYNKSMFEQWMPYIVKLDKLDVL